MSELRVAAYCRVSTNHEEQDSSFEAQISYYEKLICGHKDWKLVNIYAEKASGTQMEKRPEFLKMLKACRQGKIDLILTKSISRFGRNTLGTLRVLYELFNLSVKVEIEKENLNNYNKEMRTIMGIYAAFAQEESKSMSDNIKWVFALKCAQEEFVLTAPDFWDTTRIKTADWSSWNQRR